MTEQMPKNNPKGIRWGWIVAALFVIAALSFFSMKGSEEAVHYYMTVSEYLERQPQYVGKKIKLAGKVKMQSLKKDAGIYSFVVEDLGKNLNVTYGGIAPDTFKDGSEVVVEGVGRPDNRFEATNLMAKCASKYSEGGLPPLEQMRGKSQY
ncbi:MAG: cytochrome c maturation protein CcmE [Deltaproteobacteria bacterium]|nr:cytochrome c maturation protein CcmE [Deltaproteobacteria bacterium]